MLDRHTKTRSSVVAGLLALSLQVHAAVDEASQPPVGRSVFDHLYVQKVKDNPTYKIPFPFEKLVNDLDSRIDKGSRTFFGVKAVFFPIGRSLQRKAGYPNVYRYPRVVITPDGESKDAIDIRDRLFIGYNEKARILEVVSYNELAGRFEFQVVHNYDSRGKPKVLYANRQTCLACHQNKSPVFSEPLWDESQANGAVAKKLQAALGETYQGLSTAENSGPPFDFNSATDRSNLFSVYQRAWDELCSSPTCRRSMLKAMLEMRLKGATDLLIDAKLDLLSKWEQIWPEGLPIPNPKIPNRDPLTSKKSLKQLVEVEAEFEPLNLREPLAVWVASSSRIKNVFSGLAHFFSNFQMRELRSAIAGRENLFEQAIDSLPDAALAAPFRPSVISSVLLTKLGRPARTQLPSDFPSIIIDKSPTQLKTRLATDTFQTFRRCASCHDNATGIPANFMSAEGRALEKNIQRCSERILYRLSMWNLNENHRQKTPMPPEPSLEIKTGEWLNGREFQLMKTYIEKEVRRRGRTLESVLKSDFSSLKSCLE